MASIFSTENELLRTYLLCVSVLALKVLFMAPLTAIQRIKNMAFINSEDTGPMKLKPKIHEDVERVRRAHLNDLENIIVFFVVSFGYILTNPSLAFATLLFRIFVAARFVYTLVYAIYIIPQPARFFTCAVGYFTTVYMAVQTIIHFM
ncbi:hypothetical protein FQR65_LT07615 [Abscondita terminalis]|nr:hypothetical protein FQR65_LT07615 [Abscondita terminalis]